MQKYSRQYKVKKKKKKIKDLEIIPATEKQLYLDQIPIKTPGGLILLRIAQDPLFVLLRFLLFL